MPLQLPKVKPGSVPPLALAATMASALVVLVPGTAAAYVGPGAGLTMLGALWALAVAIVIALGGLVIWPIRAVLRSRKRPTTTPAEPAAEDARHPQR